MKNKKVMKNYYKLQFIKKNYLKCFGMFNLSKCS